MYSAFSFGKVIKTILPGSILTAALFLLCETVWFRLTGTSLAARLSDKQLWSVAGAVMVPASLLLGFLLNTFVWLGLNEQVRTRVEAELRNTPFAQMRAALCERLRHEVDALLGPARSEACRQQWPQRLGVEYYFLPVVSVDHLTYLWESYFSWCEFHLNALCALAFSLSAVWLVLLVRVPLGPGAAIGGGVVATLATLALCRTLWRSAIRNMTAYERNLMLLVSGSVGAAAARPGAGRRVEPARPTTSL